MMRAPVMSPSASAPLELALSFDKVQVQTISSLLNILSESVPEGSFCATMLCVGIFSFSRLETGEYTVPGSCGMREAPLTPPENVVQQDESLCLRNFCEAYLRSLFQVHVSAPKLSSSAVEGSLLIDWKKEHRRFSEHAPRFADDCSKYACISKESNTEASKLSVNFNDKGRSKKRKIDQWGVVAAIKDDEDEDDDDDEDEDDDDADNEDVEGDEGEGDCDEKNTYNDKEEGSDEEASDEHDGGGGEKDEAEEEEEENDDDDDDDNDDDDDDNDDDDDGDDDDEEEEEEPPKKRKK